MQQHNVQSVLRQHQPITMRRKNMKKIWGFVTLVVCFMFLSENVVFIILPAMNPDVPDHPNDLLQNTDRYPRNDWPEIDSPDVQYERQERDISVPTKSRILKKKRHDIDIATPKPTRRRFATTAVSRWIVVSSQNDCDVTHFTKLPGWKVVVVGKSPRGCKAPACTYIDAAKAKSIRHELTNLLPGGSESRKIFGYLYAISKGAKVIYDTTCDVVPKFNNLGFRYTGNTSGLEFTGGPIFNPHGHFGYPMLYSRGFPENSLKVKGQGRYRVVDIEVPAIQQGQINFILGKKDVSYLKLAKDINITFDRSSPPVFLSARRYGPVNSLNTLFLYKAFWALFLPAKYKGDVDIVRGYIAQRLLAEIGGSTGFLSPTAYSLASRMGKNKFVVLKQTTSSYIEDLINASKIWKCDYKMSFFGCARSLIKHLVGLNLLTKKDTKIYDIWISSLKHRGYREPKRRNQIDVALQPSHWNPEVIYQSPKIIPSEILLRTGLVQSNSNNHVFNKLHKICPKHTHTVAEWLNPPITDIMLVVIFNYDFLFKNLPYMEFSHRLYFRHILYCGPSFKGFAKVVKATNMHHLNYINGVDKDTWFFTYQCIVHAANMNLNVKGYLYIGDDILLNTWNILDLPRDKFWMPMPLNYIDRHQAKHWWYYWNKPVGRTAANLVLEEIRDLAKKNPNDKMVPSFLSMYDKNVKLSRVVHRSIDVFYAPAVYNEEIVKFGRIFRNHSTLLGLAVPMLQAGLVDIKDVVRLKGKSLWKDGRSNNIGSFKEDNHYLHPFKAGKDLDSKEGRNFFCNTYLTLSQRKLKAERQVRRRKLTSRHRK